MEVNPLPKGIAAELTLGVGIEPLFSASTGSQVQLTTPWQTAPDISISIFLF